MKERLSKKIIDGYRTKIENSESRYDLNGIIIEISQKCSSYKISWAEFMAIRKIANERKALVK